jgi:hypothetical protein
MRVRNPDWLKAAALYWDSMRRFRPPGYTLRDPPVSRELVDCGFLKTVNPEPYAADVSSDLLGFMQENVRVLREQFSLGAALDGPLAGPAWGTEGPGGSDKRLGWIHSRKMSLEFSDFPAGEGLAQIGRGADSRWVGVHPTIAAAYMLALTAACAERERLDPVTDKPSPELVPARGVEAAIRLLASGASAWASDEPDRNAAGFAMAAIEFAMPRDLSQVSVEQVLQVRERLQEELAGFRDFVAAQRDELEQLASIGDREIRAEAFTSHFSARIEKPLERLERGFRLSGLDTGRAVLMTQTFAPPAAFAAVGLGHAPPAVAAAGGVAVVIGSAWWQLTRTRRHMARESPVGYLLSINKVMRARTIAERKAVLLSRRT